MFPLTRLEVRSLVLASVGIFLQVFSGYWDVYSHRVFFQESDPIWNPAHLALYSGGLMVLGAAILWYRNLRERARSLPGFVLIILGAGLEVTAAVTNEVWHLLVAEDPSLAPPHVLLVLGMIITVFGIVTALSILRSSPGRGSGHDRRLHLLLGGCLLLSFVSAWLVSVGSAVYIGHMLDPGRARYGLVLVVAALGPLVAVPASRVFGRWGPLTLLGGAVALVNWVLLLGYVGTEPYPPLSVLSMAAVDVQIHLTRWRLGDALASVAAGALLGFLYNLTYFPFVFEVSWLPVLDATVLGVTLSGALGGLTAHVVVTRTGSWARRKLAAMA